MLDKAREAYDAFLDRYPYCYGYWKKYADLEKLNGNDDVTEKVYERGVQAIPLSIDLWIHYITFVIELSNGIPDADSIQKTDRLFERALSEAGLEFRSDRLWETYIEWLNSRSDKESICKVMAVYDRLLKIPTLNYKQHFNNFCNLLHQHHPKDLLSLEEFLALRKLVIAKPPAPPTVASAYEDDTGDVSTADEPPPGVDVTPGNSHSPDISVKTADEEVTFLRQKITEQRQTWHQQTEEEVVKRWSYEEAIRRPYFHVKPLEKAQLKTWREYLDFEMEAGDHTRVVVLFERCLIACALYEEFWMKYAKYMMTRDVEKTRDVYKRACTIHLPQKASLHLAWSAFEERCGRSESALRIVTDLEKNVPGLVMATLRHISIERRRGNADAVDALYKKCIADATTTEVASFYSIKYARYLSKVRCNMDYAKKALEDALQKDPSNSKLYLQLVDMEYQRPVMDQQAMLTIFDRAVNSDLSLEQRVSFSQRKLEFLEDFGSNVDRIIDAYDTHQKLQHELQTVRKHRMSADANSQDERSAKRAKTDDDAYQQQVNGDATQQMAASTAAAAAAAAAMATQAQVVAATCTDTSMSAYNYTTAWPGYTGAVYDYRQAAAAATAWPAAYQSYYGTPMH